MYRCHPQIARGLELLRSGELGKVQRCDVHFGFAAPFDASSRLFARQLGGGGILDIGGYPVSLAMSVAGAAADVDGMSVPTGLEASGQLAATGVDAHAEASLTFESGFRARVVASITEELGRGAVVTCSEGRLVFQDPFLPDGQRKGREARLVIESQRAGTREECVTADYDCYALEALLMADSLASRSNSSRAGSRRARPGCQPLPPLPSHAESLAIARVLDGWRDQLSSLTPPAADGTSA
jgi:predicted dehydrogenase